MGYRSQVRYSTTIDGWKAVKEYCQQHPVADSLISGPDMIDVNNHIGSVVLGWDNVKWYDDYDEVRQIVNAFNSLDECDPPLPWQFLRIGEDIDDVEQTYGCKDDLWNEPPRTLATTIVTEYWDSTKPAGERLTREVI